MAKSYWEKALLTATYLINKLPSRVLNFHSPTKVLTTFFPKAQITYNLIPCVFDYVACVHIHQPQQGKLNPRPTKCLFVRYLPT